MGEANRRSLPWRVWVVAFFLGCGLCQAAAAGAQQEFGRSVDERGFWKDVGLGAGAACSNILYIPAKLAYAAVGGVVGGLAYAVTLGSTETANAVWEPTLGGTYVLTPGILTGKEKLRFNGRPPLPPPPAPQGFEEYDGGWTQ